MKKGLLSIAACLVTLVALEVALRVARYDSLAAWRNGRELILRPSVKTDLLYELTPGASGSAWDTEIRINSRGFRGPEPLPQGAAGGLVVVLGDSITFGHYLREESTFPRVLERRLRTAGWPLQVFNFGVGGYDVLQEVSLLASRPEYHPTLVVLAYCLNDAGIAGASRAYIRRLLARENTLLNRSVLAQFVSARIERVRNEDWETYENRPDVFHRQYERQIDAIGDGETRLLELMRRAPSGEPFEWYGQRDRVGRIRFAFRQLSAMSHESHFPVVVMIVPWLTGNEHTHPQRVAHQIVELEAQRAGFDTLDPTEDFESAGMEKLRITPGDLIHPNESGHALMARMLDRYVQAHTPRP